MDEKRKKINKEVNSAARSLKLMDEYDEEIHTKNIFDEDIFGICHDCMHFRCAETKYGNAFANCWEFEVRLNASDPVTKCSQYKKRGEMTLIEMKDMAYIIEIEKRKAGFDLT